MIERELRQPAGTSVMRLFVSRPEQAPKRYPLCVLLMDAPGYRPELQAMARRLATSGYAVALPDLYHRSIGSGLAPDPQRLAAADPRRREYVYRHMNAVNLASASEDLQAVLTALVDDPQIDQSALGLFGYCMSGPLALGLAGRFPAQVAAAASIHGVRLFHQGPASGHRQLASAQAELYFACAEQDDWAPPSVINALGRWLQSTGLVHRIDWYPGTEHGFVFPERDGLYVEAAAERHWAALLDLFERRLKQR